jgi:hypothetical protein
MVSFKRPDNYSRTTNGFAFYDDPEELYAVLVQGIYASEGKTPVRSSHTGHYPIDKQLDKSFEFYKTGTESFDLIGRFCTENPGFTREIACIETHFSPIRAYYFTPAAAKQMVQSKFAKARDQAEPLFNGAYHWLLNQFRNESSNFPLPGISFNPCHCFRRSRHSRSRGIDLLRILKRHAICNTS